MGRFTFSSFDVDVVPASAGWAVRACNWMRLESTSEASVASHVVGHSGAGHSITFIVGYSN